MLKAGWLLAQWTDSADRQWTDSADRRPDSDDEVICYRTPGPRTADTCQLPPCCPDRQTDRQTDREKARERDRERQTDREKRR